MSAPQVHVLNTIEEVESLADRWNDLWLRSDVTSPLGRAEFLRSWLDQFAPDRRFQTIIIEEAGRLVAALPLVARRWGKLIPFGGLPRNEWGGAGDLLVDSTADSSRVLRLIAGTLQRLSWALYRFSQVRTDSRTWQNFTQPLEDEGLAAAWQTSHDVKLIPIPDDWEAFRSTWSRNHRQRLPRLFRRLQEQGELCFRRHVPTSAVEAAPLLHRAFTIEDSGWKGRARTSLLSWPGIANYVRRQCELLIPRGELEIDFLELSGEPICFQILWNSKNTLHAYKGSYDERFQQFSPGHLLIHELLRDACEHRRCAAYDCLGPNTPALEQWGGSTYRTSQLTVATRQWLGRAVLFTYQHCRRPSRQLRSGASAGLCPKNRFPWENEAPAEPRSMENAPFVSAQQELRPPDLAILGQSPSAVTVAGKAGE